MKNEKGLTLIEVLVTIVILGIVIFPLINVLAGTFTRTLSQEKDTVITYVAQEVMEKVMHHQPPLPLNNYCWSNVTNSCESTYSPLTSPFNQINTTDPIKVIVSVSAYNFSYNEIKVSVSTTSNLSNGSERQNKINVIDLVTVVKKP